MCKRWEECLCASACHQDTSLLSGSLRFCLDPLGRFSDEQLWQMVHLMGIQGWRGNN